MVENKSQRLTRQAGNIVLGLRCRSAQKSVFSERIKTYNSPMSIKIKQRDGLLYLVSEIAEKAKQSSFIHSFIRLFSLSLFPLLHLELLTSVLGEMRGEAGSFRKVRQDAYFRRSPHVDKRRLHFNNIRACALCSPGALNSQRLRRLAASLPGGSVRNIPRCN